MSARFIPIFQPRVIGSVGLRWLADLALLLLSIVLPNLLLALHYAQGIRLDAPQGVLADLIAHYGGLPSHAYYLWGVMDFVVFTVWLIMRKLVVTPLGHITQHLQELRSTYNHELGLPTHTPLNVARLAAEVGRFSTFALEHYRKHQEVSAELAQARETISQFAFAQQTILESTNRDILQQYRSVLAYANYLEDQITTRKIDPSLRYDFDDVCETSFNLKLIAGALSVLGQPRRDIRKTVPLGALMQQTMLALAPSLDRRSMKLTTAEVDLSVAARGDPEVLAQILWMMLLGMIRYAADESTLRIRCLHNREGTQAMLSIVVSELCYSRMREDGEGEALLRHLQHLTPAMFAETIRIHSNLQLANLLAQRFDGHISVLPLTLSACEICMLLPAAEIIKQCE